MKNKIFSLLLAIVASTNMLFAESGWCGSMVRWNLKDGVLTISGEGSMNDYTFSWNTCSSPWYNYRTSINSIIVRDGVVSVGKCAFYGCNKVTTVTIGSDVASIGEDAFTKCTNLTSVILHSNTIVSHNYPYDDNLCSIFGNQVNEYVIGEGISEIGEYAFNNSANLSSITLPSSLTSIGDYSFSNCSSLPSIVFPKGLTSIGRAFSNCVSLTAIEIPSKVTYLHYAAFNGCNNLTSVFWNSNEALNNSTKSLKDIFKYMTECVIGDSVKYIGGIFDGCNRLVSVTIPSSVTLIGQNAFRGCTNLNDVHISDIAVWCGIRFYDETSSPLYYAQNLYVGNELLTDLVIPDNVTSVEYLAFANCKSITSITIPEHVTTLKVRAFENCNNLVRVTINSNSVMSETLNIRNMFKIFGANVREYIIGDSVTTIGESAFKDCTAMTSITIGNGVSDIKNNAFTNCSSLVEVHVSDLGAWCNISFEDLTASPLFFAHNLYLNNDMISDLIIPDSVTVISNYAFNGCTSISSLTISKSMGRIGDNVFDNCTNLTSITWRPENHGGFYSATKAPFYSIRTQINSFTFGDEVRDIPAYLCNGMSNIPSVTFPNSVTGIGRCAFDGCSSIKSLIIDSNIQRIDWGAFTHCSNLKTLTLNSNQITSKTYFDELNLCDIFGTYLMSCTFGDSIISIGDFAFFESNLTMIEMGKNISSIGDFAFYDCAKVKITVHSLPILYWAGNRDVSYCVIGDEITSIGNNAFSYNESLFDVSIGNNVTTIGAWAFEGCRNLISITLPSGLTSIGYRAFYDCSRLYDIRCKAVVPPTFTGEEVFANVDKTIPLFVPAESIDLYKTAEGWSDFTNIFALSATAANVSSVYVEPSDNNATIYWPSFDDAAIYTIEIQKDGSLIHTLSFDYSGNIQWYRLSHPSYLKFKKSITTDATGWKYNIPGLEANSSYTLTCTVADSLTNTIFNQTITFNTESTPSVLECIPQMSANEKLFRNGHIFIRRGEKEYTLTGQQIK